MSRQAVWFLLVGVLLGAGHGPARSQEAAGGDSVHAAPAAGATEVTSARSSRSGGQALAVGLTCTLAPAAVGALLFPAQEDGQGGEAGIAVGAALGLLAGPALGLASGGRGDLAGRGLLIRGSMYLLFSLSTVAIVSGDDGDSLESLGGIAVLGLVMGGVSVVSAAHDLAITPGAVERGRPVTVQPVVDPRGYFALRARF